jgi:hypothetical protein
MRPFQLFALLMPLFLAAGGSISHGAEVSGQGLVTEYHAYGDVGGGDVVFFLNATITGCSGAWLSPAQPGFKTLLASLVAAKFSQKPLTVYLDNAQLWEGSGNPHCKVKMISVK